MKNSSFKWSDLTGANQRLGYKTPAEGFRQKVIARMRATRQKIKAESGASARTYTAKLECPVCAKLECHTARVDWRNDKDQAFVE